MLPLQPAEQAVVSLADVPSPRKADGATPPQRDPSAFKSFLRTFLPVSTRLDVAFTLFIAFCACLAFLSLLGVFDKPSLSPFSCDDPRLQAQYGREVLKTKPFVAFVLAVPSGLVALLNWRRRLTRSTRATSTGRVLRRYFVGLLLLADTVQLMKAVIDAKRPHFIDSCRPAFNTSNGVVLACSENKGRPATRTLLGGRAFPHVHQRVRRSPNSRTGTGAPYANNEDFSARNAVVRRPAHRVYGGGHGRHSSFGVGRSAKHYGASEETVFQRSGTSENTIVREIALTKPFPWNQGTLGPGLGDRLRSQGVSDVKHSSPGLRKRGGEEHTSAEDLHPEPKNVVADSRDKLKALRTSKMVAGFFCSGTTEAASRSSGSFPSGHSALGCYAAGFVVGFLVARGSTVGCGCLREFLIFFSVSGSLVVSIARVFEGMHHWSDVLCGAVIGYVWAVACVLWPT